MVGYKKVEYIESTGNQAINTGIFPNTQTGFEIKFSTTSTNSNTSGSFGTIMGVRNTYSTYGYQLTTYTDNAKKGHFLYGSGSTVDNIRFDAGITTNAINVISFSGSGTDLVNNDVVVSTPTNTTFSQSYALTVFGLNQAGTYTEFSKTKIYYLKIYQDGALVRDYIPVIKEDTNEAGLFDLTSNTFYKKSVGSDLNVGNVITGEQLYIGVNNIAKKTKKAYIGVNGKAKEVKKAYIGVNGKAQLCYYNPYAGYNYGDGSLNKVQNGYDGLLYINGSLATNYVTSNTKNYGNSIRYMLSGDNWDGIIKTIEESALEHGVCMVKDANPSITSPSITSGTQLYSTTISSTDGDKTVHVEFNATGTSTSTRYGKLAFNVDGTLMDLDGMIASNIIKPLVLISSAHLSSTSYIVPYVLNMFSKTYTGSTNRTYTQFNLQFMLNQGHTISQVQLYSYSSLSNSKFGYAVTPIEYARITLNPY